MKRAAHDHLLQAVLADENLARLRERSLVGGLTSLRQRRRRRALLTTAASLALLLLVFVVAQRRPAPIETPVFLAAKSSTVKFITDEQLFALFPNRATALVGSPGAQKFIFLDGPATPSAAVENR